MAIWKRRPKRRKPLPQQRAYKYCCPWGHIRIEKDRLGTPLPNCPACEKAGQVVLFRYVGPYRIPLNQLKKSKFN